jgi:hypothetical protein
MPAFFVWAVPSFRGRAEGESPAPMNTGWIELGT